jgi:hypothetical protein
MNQYRYYRIIYNTLIRHVTLLAGTMDDPRSSALSGRPKQLPRVTYVEYRCDRSNFG